jgi:hypothetical protein
MSRTWPYIIVAVGLVLIGAALFSIGIPFVLTGLVMLLLLPWRRRREILWPSLASVWGLTLGYVLVAPLSCTSSVASAGEVLYSGGPVTTCNGLFFDYVGGRSYNPPLLPALLVGVMFAVAAGLAVRALLTHRASNASGHDPTWSADVGSHS